MGFGNRDSIMSPLSLGYRSQGLGYLSASDFGGVGHVI